MTTNADGKRSGWRYTRGRDEYHARMDLIQRRVTEGVSDESIARELCLSLYTVRNLRLEAGIKRLPVQPNGKPTALANMVSCHKQLHSAARARNMRPDTLVVKIMEAVLEDDLVDAMLIR